MIRTRGFSGFLDRLAGTPAENAGTEAAFRARMCLGTLLSLATFCAVLLATMLLNHEPGPMHLIVAGCVLFYLGLVLVARRIESKSRLATVLSIYLALVVGLSLSLAGGSPASVTPWVVVVPLLAGLLVGPRQALGCFVLLAMEMVLLLELRSRGLLPPPDLAVLDGAIGVFSTCAAALLVVVLSYLDVTARQSRHRELERTLLRLEEEVRHREQTRREVQHSQNLKALGQLTAGVTHEINTPVQYVTSNSAFVEKVLEDLVEVYEAARVHVLESRFGANPGGLAELDVLTTRLDKAELLEQLPDAVMDMREGLGRVKEVIEAMRYFVHPGQKGEQMVDLNRAIWSTVTVTRNEWRYVADLKLDLDPDLPPVAVSAGEMNQVFLNLLVNAAHAIGEKKAKGDRGEIRVATRSDGAGITIMVSDDGSGIPDEIRPKIFDPYFTTKGVGVGTGQGLALVWSTVVERNGGTINVTSGPDCGTTFVLTLPRTSLREIACAV